MKTFTKKILAVIVLLVLSISLLPMSAMAYEPGDFDYELDDNGNATIIDYNGSGGEVTIPAELDGHPVTAIGYSAFYNDDSITSLTFKGDIDSIDYDGGTGTFQYCDGIKYVTFEGNVGTIGENAFCCCEGLITVTFQGDVGTIGENAFQYCDSLKYVTFEGNVGTIVEEAFYCCEGLTTVTFQGDVGTIGDEAFYACEALKDIYFNGTEAEWNAVTKGEYWNYACPENMEIHFSEYAVEVSASPADGGIVAGGTTYGTGTTATVTATPKKGYVFVNWTEGGTEVSTDASYSFTVEKKRSLVANFAKTYPLWVGGVQVTSANADNITGDGIAVSDGGNVKYDASTNTLTLNNATVTGTVPDFSGAEVNIYAENIDLIVELIGTSNVQGGEDAFYLCEGKLTITGGGKLTADGTNADIVTDKDLRITDGCDITGGLFSFASITIEGSTVNAIDPVIYPISASGNITITDSDVTSYTPGIYGVACGKTFKISGDSTFSSEASSKALFADRGIVIGDGLIVAEGSPDGPKYVISKGYPLWVGGKQVSNVYLSNEDEGWSFDPSTSTLTLNNANITGMYSQYESGTYKETYNIYYEDLALTIDLVGENKVGDGSAKFAIYANEGDLTIGGTGSLDAESSVTGIVTLEGDITITEGTVTAKGGSIGMLSTAGNITISGGTVTGEGAGLFGIAASGTLTITGGTVTGETKKEGTDDEPTGGITAGKGITIGDNVIISSSDEGVVGTLTTEEGEQYFVMDGDKAALKAVVEPGGILTFDLNGGTLNGQTGKITMKGKYGDTINLPGAPTKEGYTFKCWKGSEYAAGAEYTVDGPHDFTAEWEEVKEEQETKQDTSPKTGDNGNAGIWAAIMGGALLVVILLVLLGRKYLKKQR